MSYKKLKHHLISFKASLSLLFSMLCLSASLWIYSQTLQFLTSLPNPQSIDDISLPGASLVYDNQGSLLYTSYDEEYRIPVELSEVPEILRLATLAAEDKRFYDHTGIDYVATARAFWFNLLHEELHGASTITQQLARTAFLNREQTYNRKLSEAVIAFRLENNFSKDEILEMYLNAVPYGGVAVGVEAASEQYFGKSVKQLSDIEAVFLASLTPAPSIYGHKNQSEETTRALISETLSRMVAAGFISEEKAIEISNQPFGFEPHFEGKRAPHAVDFTFEELAKIPEVKPYLHEGVEIYTSLNLDLQESLEHQVISEINKYSQKYNMNNAAVIVAHPQTGELIAMVGSASYWDKEGQFNAATATRQLGSTLKIVPYALALESAYTPDTTIKDTPITFSEYDNYKPKNYDNRFHGTVTLRSALANSYNIPALKLTYILGVHNVANLGYKMGISEYQFSNFIPLSLAIGGVDTSLLNATQAYQTVANGGEKIPLSFIDKIVTHDGEVIYERPGISERIISRQTASGLFKILSDERARQPAFGKPKLFKFPISVAIKTGTSNDVRDNVAIAFTDQFVVSSWVGNNDNSPMRGVTSGSVGASLFMNAATSSVIKESNTASAL